MVVVVVELLTGDLLLGKNSIQIIVRAAGLRLLLRLLPLAAGSSKDGGDQKLSAVRVLTRTPGTLQEQDKRSIK